MLMSTLCMLGGNCFKCVHNWELFGKGEPIYLVRFKRKSKVSVHNVTCKLFSTNVAKRDKRESNITHL